MGPRRVTVDAVEGCGVTRWTEADLAAELDALEREVEATGLGPARTVELAGGAWAVVDARGRVHEVVVPSGWGALREAA